MRLVVNGHAREVDLGEAPTVASLLREVTPPGVPCAVEVNRAVVPLARHTAVALRDGDEVEIVTFVGGG